jgi:glycerol dehydrogenase-like iron-containing ADH family enzyme
VQRHDLGYVPAGGLGDLLAQIFEPDLALACEVAEVRSERRPLQVGKDATTASAQPASTAKRQARSGPTRTVLATVSSATSMSSADCGAPSVAAAQSTIIGPSSVRRTLPRLSRPCEIPAV